MVRDKKGQEHLLFSREQSEPRSEVAPQVFEYTGFMTRFADRGAAARRFSVTQWGSNRRPRAAAGYSKKNVSRVSAFHLVKVDYGFG